MTDVRLVIDGTEVVAAEGTTILEVAEQNGIHVPTLCYKPDLTPHGGCRICAVEVEGSPRLVASCHTLVNKGMIIRTNTRKVRAARSAMVELLLTGHTGSCVTDVDAKHCELHKLAADLEVGLPRFQVRNPRHYLVEDVSPYVRRDMSKCILCHRCIRACNEVAKKFVYSMAYRGFPSKVVVDCDVPINKEVCRDCGICIDYCPTSALSRPKNVGGEKKAEGDMAKNQQQTIQARGQENLLTMAEDAQQKFGCVSEKFIFETAQALNIPVSEVYGVVSFYSFLSVKPLGKNVIRICKSIPCYLKNSQMMIESLKKELGIAPGETTADRRFSFQLTNCIGACDKSPAMLVNDDVHGHLTPEKISEILRSYK